MAEILQYLPGLMTKFFKGLWPLSLALILSSQNLVLAGSQYSKLAEKKLEENFISIEKVFSNAEIGQGLELLAKEDDLALELDEDSTMTKEIKFKIDASQLLVKSSYPQLIKIKAYTKNAQEEESVIQIVDSSVYNLKQARNFNFSVVIPETFSSDNLWLDVYDSNINLAAGFKRYIERSSRQETSDLVAADCDNSNFGDCQLNYILNSISYQATASKKAEAVVSKEANGKYIVSLPLVKAKNLKIINQSNPNSQIGQGDSLSSSEVINVVKAGDFSFSKLRLAEKSLSADPPDNGTLEFDGSKLYLTKNGRREELVKEGPSGSSGAPGPPGQRGEDGSFSGGDATINGVLTFTNGGGMEAAKINDFMNLSPQASAPGSPNEGDVYYDSSGAVCIYVSGAWGKMYGAGSCPAGTDNTPDAFSFADTGNIPATLTVSNQITIQNLDASAITISGTGNPEYSINSGAYTSSSGTINHGDTLSIRLTSNAGLGLTNSAMVTIGTSSDTWTVRTITCPQNFVYIPGSAGYDVYGNVDASYPGGWCVSQYEMSPQGTALWLRDGLYGWHYTNSSGTGKKITARGGSDSFPITFISHDQAAIACANDLTTKNSTVLINGQLLTVYWWSKIAQAIVDDALNWSNNIEGSTHLSRGNANHTYPLPGPLEGTVAINPADGVYYYTNDTGRAWRLGSGQGVIYDFAGNTREHFHELHANWGGNALRDINGSIAAYEHDNPNGPANITLIPSENSSHDTTANGLGRIYANATSVLAGSSYAAYYGGYYYDNIFAGVFASYWYASTPTAAGDRLTGFRCIIPSQ